jgi:hypothetical protein
VAAGRPWWQMTKTARQGFILGSIYGVLSLGEWASVLFLGAHVWNVGVAVPWLCLAVKILLDPLSRKLRAPQLPDEAPFRLAPCQPRKN